MQTLLVLEALMHFMDVQSSYNVIKGAEHDCVLRQFIFNPLKQRFQNVFKGETYKIIFNIPRIPHQ